MKKITRNLSMIFAALAILTIVSCGEDNEDIFTPVDTDEFDARLNNNATDSLTATVFLTDIDDNSIDVLLSFSSDEPMRRVYITRNIQGQGDEKVEADELFPSADVKGDGSLDLGNESRDSFAFNLGFSTAGLPTEGTVVYNFWATRNKGDFRDPTKDASTEVATLTIEVTGTNPAQALKEYTNTITLQAPTADGESETFISMLDGEVYEINEGEEFASFWDFGFYYLNSTGVSLASTVEYPNLFKDPNDPAPEGETSLPLVDVNTFLGIEATAVNNAYFQLAPDGTDFDSFETIGDLDFNITISDDEDINDLEVGDVVYILDQYGNKGVIKITDLVGSFGSDGFVEFDMKVAL